MNSLDVQFPLARALSGVRALWTTGMRRSLLGRVWWGLLVLIHVVPLQATTEKLVSGGWETTPAFNAAVLWLATALFVLKFFNVRWMRWRMHRTGAMVFILVCALVHDGIAPAAARQAMLAELPTAAAAALATEALARSSRGLARILHDLFRALQNALAHSRFATTLLVLPLHEALRRHVDHISVPRAPPA